MKFLAGNGMRTKYLMYPIPTNTPAGYSVVLPMAKPAQVPPEFFPVLSGNR